MTAIPAYILTKCGRRFHDADPGPTSPNSTALLPAEVRWEEPEDLDCFPGPETPNTTFSVVRTGSEHGT